LTASDALYPSNEPFNQGRLKVSDLHEIYFEECGNPKGKPVLIVHGGPGAGCNPSMRRYHDPKAYRIILFDQRGCGRSTPHAELTDNTTWHLVEDMEAIRQHLGIDMWQLFGGSWGSTLALAYAETHPERVRQLVLRGIFLMRRSEVEWFYQEGASNLYPDHFQTYRDHIPADERSDMVTAYHHRLTHEDKAVQLAAAKKWSVWEGSTLSLLPNPGRQAAFANEHYALAFARIECHYFFNGGFFEHDGQLLTNADRLQGIPGTIVHGRYDVVTPLANAWELTKVWTAAELQVVNDAGHAMSEPGIARELVKATEKYKKR